MRRPLSSAAFLLAGLALVGGCSTPNPYTATAQAPQVSPAEQTRPRPAAMALRIPALGINQPVPLPLGLEDAGQVEVPPLDQPDLLGYWTGGVEPGDAGWAPVILGHISGRLPGADHSIPGVFAHLDQLTPGATVEVTRRDGRTVTFRVSKVEQHPKTAFPTEATYGQTERPEIRLVSCTGRLAGGHFDKNLIVWAVAA